MEQECSGPSTKKRKTGRRCIVGGCSNESKHGFFMHRMPGKISTIGEKLSPIQKRWIAFIGRKRKFDQHDARKYSSIIVCSGHFTAADYEASDIMMYNQGLRMRSPALTNSAFPSVDDAHHPFQFFPSPSSRTFSTSACTTSTSASSCSVPLATVTSSSASSSSFIMPSFSVSTPLISASSVTPVTTSVVSVSCSTPTVTSLTSAICTPQSSHRRVSKYARKKVCGIHFPDGRPTEEHPYPVLHMGYDPHFDISHETMMEDEQPEESSKTEPVRESKRKVYIKEENDENEASCYQYTVLDLVQPSTMQVKCEFIPVEEDANLQDNHNAEVDADVDADVDAGVDSDGWINDDSDGWINDDSPSPTSNTSKGTGSCQVKCHQKEGYESISSGATASEGESQSKISLKDTHEVEIFHECCTCNNRFSLKSLLDEHMTTHIKCSKCSETFKSRKNLSRHMKLHRTFQPVQLHCWYCSKTFCSSSSLSLHVKSHKGKDLYHCYQCSDKFKSKGKLTDHMRIHARRDGGRNPYKCYMCNLAYSKQADLESHFILRHPEEQLFQCSLCNKRFSQWRSVSQHMTNVHFKDSQYFHSYCTQTKRFIVRSTLPEKMRLEIEERPFQCFFCGKRYQSKRHLSSHTKVHGKQRHRQCSFCNRRFYAKGHLSNHMKECAHSKGKHSQLPETEQFQPKSVHSKKVRSIVESPFQCCICSKRYATKKSLSAHEKRHR